MSFASPPFRHDDTADPWFEGWRRRQARKEYRRFVGRFASADGYKDDPHRTRTLHEYGEERAREGGRGEALAKKKEELRERWHLSSYTDIHA